VAPLLTYRQCHFLRGKGEKYRRNNIFEIYSKSPENPLQDYLKNCLIVLYIPPTEFCKRQSIFENRQKFSMLFFNFFAVLEYALPFTKFYWRNDENRIDRTTKEKGNLSLAFEKAVSKHIRELAQQNKGHFRGPQKVPLKN
jgi:hypothetical protein